MRGRLRVTLVVLGRNRVRHSLAQHSSTLRQVHTHFDDQTSARSYSGGSSDDNSDYHGSVGQAVDWKVVQGHVGKFTRACPSTTGASDHAEDSQVPDKLKLKLIPTDDCVGRPLDLPRDEDLDPRPLEDDLLYSNALLFLLRNLLVDGLPFLGGLACGLGILVPSGCNSSSST